VENVEMENAKMERKGMEAVNVIHFGQRERKALALNVSPKDMVPLAKVLPPTLSLSFVVPEL